MVRPLKKKQIPNLQKAIKETAWKQIADLEGVILLAKSQNDPEVIYRLSPAIKTLRVETAA